MRDTALQDHIRWFKKYTADFLGQNAELDFAVELKREHTFAVVEETQQLCGEEEISGRRAFLAGLSSLYHDIGRFEQFQRYRTFNDKISENHALLGVRILQEHRILAALSAEEAAMVETAVANHNALTPPGSADRAVNLLTSIVRDADKIDILRIAADHYLNADEVGGGTIEIGLPDSPEISTDVVAAVRDRRTVRYGDLKTVNDFKLLKLAWVYDLNFRYSRRAVLARGYLEMIRDTLPETGEVDALYHRIVTFLRNGNGR